MENSTIIPNVRIKRITLTDFRNIQHSTVDIPGGKMADYLEGETSILGLYGQNGSGKTSLLLALNALKKAMSGEEFLYPMFSSCIREGCEKTRLEFEFSAYNEKGAKFDIYYGFSIGIDNSEVETNREKDPLAEAVGMILSEKSKAKIMSYVRPNDRRLVIFDELLQCAMESETNEKSNKQILIDTSEKSCNAGRAFGNKTRYEQFTENSADDIHDKLNKWKMRASISSTSFIFSKNVLKALINGCSIMSYKLVLRALSEFAENYLFVIQTDATAYNSMKVMPLSLWLNDESGAIGITIPLDLSTQCEIADAVFDNLKAAIEKISDVISQIVPQLKLEVNDLGKKVTENGQDDVRLFTIASVRNDVHIPLAYESDGTRRIISFLSLIVAVYNNPSVTLAVDEIDSGIFEYMLGEILSVLQDSAKGQLIFTSHNLRPLEVLPLKNLLFTTINPNNRFAKLEGISGNNNLRDCYFRTIQLGTGKDTFYDATDTFNIEQALFEAGNREEL